MVEEWSLFYYQHHHLELENLLRGHHAIADAGVVGIPDMFHGEVCHAYLCLEQGYQLTNELTDDLAELITKRYAKDCVPEKFFVVDKMPKTRSGKLSRQQLKSWALESSRQI